MLRLVGLHEYGVSREHVFPSRTSMDWFLRKNKPALVAEGALINDRWSVVRCPCQVDAYVLAEGSRAAAARLKQDAAD